RRTPRWTLVPYTTLFRSRRRAGRAAGVTDDVFGTAALRRAVLEAWRSSPTRLREDANTEEDHAHGSYRGRVVVELAQNAADAARSEEHTSELQSRENLVC